jgi:DNA-binding response OmpR family regulator
MTSPNLKILVVDDDQAIRDVLTAALEVRFAIITAPDARTAREQVRDHHPDLILLDLVLPDTDGMVLLPTLRRDTPVPIIVLSARHSQADGVLSRKFGADDFIDKPFDLDDLDARIDAVLRRSTPPPIPEYGALNMTPRRMPTIGGLPFYVTRTEYGVLDALVAAHGEVVSKTDLTERFWYERDESPHQHNLHVVINQLRRRLERQHSAPRILNARGQGYYLKAAAP